MNDTPRFDEASALDEARLHRIGRATRFERTEEPEKRMRERAGENAPGKRPVHHSTLEKFGFSGAGLNRDFARYRERFIASGD